jgi:hypothetical protein
MEEMEGNCSLSRHNSQKACGVATLPIARPASGVDFVAMMNHDKNRYRKNLRRRFLCNTFIRHKPRSASGTTFLYCRCLIHSGSGLRTFGQRRVDPWRWPSFRCQTRRRLPAGPGLTASSSFPGNRDRREGIHPLPRPHHVIKTGTKPVASFVPLHVPGTTRKHTRRRRHCLAASSPGSRPVLLEALSQTAAFETPARHGRHRLPAGGHSPSSVSDNLHATTHVRRANSRPGHSSMSEAPASA